MQFSLLNKTITFILVGGLLLGLLGFYFFEQLFGTNQEFQQFNSSMGANALVLIPLSMAAGVVLDAATDLTIRELLMTATYKDTMIAKLLSRAGLQTKMKRRMTGWRNAFGRYHAAEISMVRGTSKDVSEDLPDHNIASAMFHIRAPKGQFDWAASHHSTYLLASNLFVLVCLSLVLGLSTGYASLPFVLSHLVVAWLLYSISLDRLLYTYSYTFRSVVLNIGETIPTSAVSAEEPDVTVKVGESD